MSERLGKGLGDTLGMSLNYSAQKVINEVEHVISGPDKGILRELAARVAEIAARPREAEKRELWYRHNDLDPVRPLVFCDPENGWYEIIPGRELRCGGDLARIWEFKLRKELFWGESMGDDRVVEPHFTVQHVFQETDRGMQEIIIGGEDNGAYSWEAPIKEYADFERLRFQRIEVDRLRSDHLLDLAREVFQDFLTVQREGVWWWSMGLTHDLVNLRGLEQVMLDMYDHPAELTRLVAFLKDEAQAKLEYLERENLLSLNSGGTYVGSGGFGYTRQLPQPDFDGVRVRPIDMWGFGESQETVLVSPPLFAEFIFPHQLSLLEQFGLNCYGCCEPVDKRWAIISRIPRLRRVSVSAWANVPVLAEMMGNRYVFSRKPNPADLALPLIDQDYIRQGIRQTLRDSRGCPVELIMKDTHTIGGNPQNVIDWCRIAREEAENL